MDSRTKQRMKTAIEGIPAGDIKPLKGNSGSYRLRVGGWRIINNMAFSFPRADSLRLLVWKILPLAFAHSNFYFPDYAVWISAWCRLIFLLEGMSISYS